MRPAEDETGPAEGVLHITCQYWPCWGVCVLECRVACGCSGGGGGGGRGRGRGLVVVVVVSDKKNSVDRGQQHDIRRPTGAGG